MKMKMSNKIDYDYEEDRLNAPITRIELIEAIDNIASNYGANGTNDGNLICDAMRDLANELKRMCE